MVTRQKSSRSQPRRTTSQGYQQRQKRGLSWEFLLTKMNKAMVACAILAVLCKNCRQLKSNACKNCTCNHSLIYIKITRVVVGFRPVWADWIHWHRLDREKPRDQTLDCVHQFPFWNAPHHLETVNQASISKKLVTMVIKPADSCPHSMSASPYTCCEAGHYYRVESQRPINEFLHCVRKKASPSKRLQCQ